MKIHMVKKIGGKKNFKFDILYIDKKTIYSGLFYKR